MAQTKAQLIDAVNGSIVDADIVGLSSSKLSGALPAISAANLTNIPAANITGTLPAISGANLTGVGGTVKQIKKTVVTAFETLSLTNGTGFTGRHDSSLTVTITPESASNIIYVSAFGFGEGNATDQSRITTSLKKVVSGGSTTYIPAAIGNRNPQFSKTGTSTTNASNTPDSFAIPNYPDTAGTTSAITYTLQFMYDGGLSNAATYYLNRIVSDQDNTGYPNFVSWIVAMEVEP